jgi:hypothetical protein
MLLGYKEEEVWEMTIGKIITLFRQYKDNFDLEESLKRNKLGYSDLIIEGKPRENIVSF